MPEKNEKKQQPQDVEGRLHDGYGYAVDLVSGKTVLLCDHDDMDAVWGRIASACQQQIEVGGKRIVSVKFSGARAAETVEAEDLKKAALEGDEVALEALLQGAGKVVVGKVDGMGILPASQIAGIRNWGPSAKVIAVEAYDAARALLASQQEASEEATAEAIEAVQEEVEAVKASVASASEE